MKQNVQPVSMENTVTSLAHVLIIHHVIQLLVNVSVLVAGPVKIVQNHVRRVSLVLAVVRNVKILVLPIKHVII